MAASVRLATALQTRGRVDQSAGMLDDGAKDKGYVLLCVATPEEDCEVHAIEEVGTCSPFQAAASGAYSASAGMEGGC